MHYVYALLSKSKNFLYIGSTGDLRKRLVEHNRGKDKSTKPYAPYTLVYYEAYYDKQDATKREQMLKHHGSVIGHLKRRVRHSIDSAKRAGLV